MKGRMEEGEKVPSRFRFGVFLKNMGTGLA